MPKKVKEKKLFVYEIYTEAHKEAICQGAPDSFVSFEDSMRGKWVFYSMGRRIKLTYSADCFSSQSSAISALAKHILYNHVIRGKLAVVGEYTALRYSQQRREAKELAKELVERGIVELKQF